MALLYQAQSPYVMLRSIIRPQFAGAITATHTQCTSMTLREKNYVRSMATVVTFFINPVRKRVIAMR